MSNGRKALITFVLALSLIANGCSLFPNNNQPNQPGPVRFKTTQKRKVFPTMRIRPTKIGKAVKIIPTKMGKAVKVIPTRIGRTMKIVPTKIGNTVKKDLNKIKPLPTPKVMRGTR
ncbi:MAG TPA: hypothetical protein VHY08_29135 [Bacillota bacterium]|nr:hypothetical protein [Bacillota bacterium]